jgi:AraC-like DNA-binding protein
MFDHPAEFVTFKASPHFPGVELYSARLVKHAFAAHAHDGYSLGAIEQGVERFRYRGSEHLAGSGSLVFLNPDELHTGQAEEDDGWTYQMLYIEPQTLRELAGRDAYFPQATAHDPKLAAYFKTCFARLWAAPDDLSFVSEFTTMIDAMVIRHGDTSIDMNKQVHVAKDAARTRAMQRVLDCIEANLDSALSIDMLAAEAGLSTFHFVRVFAARFHVTPHQYVQARRALRAKNLLAQRVSPVETAAAVGLTDQSHLNRWFKRAYGVTPAQYQQQIGTRPRVAKSA